MLEEKLYSISEIAKITKLTDRTIRNYLASGTLKGRKIGGQWRFTRKDIEALYSNDEFEGDMQDKTQKNIVKYFKEEKSDDNTACIIMKLNIKSKEQRKELFSKIKQVVPSELKKEGITFIDEDGHIKMVLISSFEHVSEIVRIVKEMNL